MYREVEELSYKETVNKLTELHIGVCGFWSRSDGWSPKENLELLDKSRLDWLVSLSKSMHRWDDELFIKEEDGDLILAWANLGALVEGALKLFLSIYLHDYIKSDKKIMVRGTEKLPDVGMFENLKQYFKSEVWIDSEKNEKTKWLSEIQYKRNAIHAYQNKNIGTREEFIKKTNEFLRFYIDLFTRVNYPDDCYIKFYI